MLVFRAVPASAPRSLRSQDTTIRSTASRGTMQGGLGLLHRRLLLAMKKQDFGCLFESFVFCTEKVNLGCLIEGASYAVMKQTPDNLIEALRFACDGAPHRAEERRGDQARVASSREDTGGLGGQNQLEGRKPFRKAQRTPCSTSEARRESTSSNFTACRPTFSAARQLMVRSSTNRHS